MLTLAADCTSVDCRRRWQVLVLVLVHTIYTYLYLGTIEMELYSYLSFAFIQLWRCSRFEVRVSSVPIALHYSHFSPQRPTKVQIDPPIRVQQQQNKLI